MDSYCFDRLLSCFWNVASCDVVKSAITQSSNLLAVSGLWGLARGISRYIHPFFSAVSRI